MLLMEQVGPNEQILWSGTKDKKVSVWEAVFNPLLPFAAIWGLFDLSAISGVLKGMRYATDTGSTAAFMIPFFLLHMLPVWLYLGGVLTSARGAKNTYYCVTDQAVYIQHGILNTTTERITYHQVLSAGTHQSFFDKRAATGDVVLTLDQIVYSGKRRTPHQRTVKIENIADYEELYHMIMQFQPQFATGAKAYTPRSILEMYANQQFGGQQYGNPQQPQYGAQQYGAPQQPQYGAQQYGNPQQPQYGAQQYGNPQQSQYGTQQYGNPQQSQYGAQQYGNPQIPQYGTQPVQQLVQPVETDMPELEDFQDPTLSAFDFQKNDPFNNSGF